MKKFILRILYFLVSPFTVYRNFWLFMEMRKRSFDELDNLLSRIDHRRSLIRQGIDVKLQKDAIKNYRLLVLQTVFILDDDVLKDFKTDLYDYRDVLREKSLLNS